MVQAFQVIEEKDWKVVMWHVQDAVALNAWVVFYLLVILGKFVFTNLFTGAMLVELQCVMNHKQIAVRREAELKKDEDATPRTNFEVILQTFEEAYQDDLAYVTAYMQRRARLKVRSPPTHTLSQAPPSTFFPRPPPPPGGAPAIEEAAHVHAKLLPIL